jgi:hypothetical protein
LVRGQLEKDQTNEISNEVIDKCAAEYFSLNASAGANPCHRNAVTPQQKQD